MQVMDDPPNPKLQATTSCPGKCKSVTNATPYTPRNALGWCIGIWWFWCHGGTVDDLRLQGPGGEDILDVFFLVQSQMNMYEYEIYYIPAWTDRFLYFV